MLKKYKLKFHDGMHKDAPAKLFEFAIKNRLTPTSAEEILWNALKQKQLNNYKFRRQHPVHRYILDFYCHEKKVAVELDGGYHSVPEQIAKDQLRRAYLASIGIREIRFTNSAIENNLKQVLDTLLDFLNADV